MAKLIVVHLLADNVLVVLNTDLIAAIYDSGAASPNGHANIHTQVMGSVVVAESVEQVMALIEDASHN